MAKAKLEEKVKRRKIIFSLKTSTAHEVILMGDFNDWNAKAHPMNKDENGVWKKTVMLFPGRYEYKFLVDGQWETDPQNDQVCFNRFGTRNSILVVSGT
jgi:1,4-alpha-glucan branching enzyme